MTTNEGGEETFFITKYARTAGIQEVRGRVSTTCPTLVSYRDGGYNAYAHGDGRQWHRTRESAVKRAEEMRKRKLVSIDKQRAKLAARVF